MLKELVKYAEIVKNKYAYEIDGCVKKHEALMLKLATDQQKMKYICYLLYKKLK